MRVQEDRTEQATLLAGRAELKPLNLNTLRAICRALYGNGADIAGGRR